MMKSSQSRYSLVDAFSTTASRRTKARLLFKNIVPKYSRPALWLRIVQNTAFVLYAIAWGPQLYHVFTDVGYKAYSRWTIVIYLVATFLSVIYFVFTRQWVWALSSFGSFIIWSIITGMAIYDLFV